MEHGPKLPISQRTHAQKHRSPGETFRESQNRVASYLKDSDEHFNQLREVLLDQRFLFGGRIQLGAGSPSRVCLHNCFVSGEIGDNFIEPGGIMDRAKEAAETMRMGGGIGYDFSSIRPRGSNISTLGGATASGPVSFMHIFDAVCKAIASAGQRRGAQMGSLRVDHPDIEEFINGKHNTDQLTAFNVSVAVTDEFMNAVRSKKPFELKWGGQVYKKIDAASLWESIMRSTWDWAEPGVLFIDRINELNNLNYCETISTTNPCAEQPLPPHGACLLGSFNLVKYLYLDPYGRRKFNWGKLLHDIPVVVRAADNVIDRAIYPLEAQEQEAKDKRRMGLGITGFANTIEALGHPYGSQVCIDFVEKLMRFLSHNCYATSIELAKEKGAFPLFDANHYCDKRSGTWVSRHLDVDLFNQIREHGIRNSHLISIAPTGSISLCADNVSSGIEPVFSAKYDRKIITEEGTIIEEITDYGYRELGVTDPVTADKCSPADHVRVLVAATKWVDSSVSKTVNVPHDLPWEDFKGLYMNAWLGGAKGCATYTIGGQRDPIMTAKPDEAPAACEIDPETGSKTCD